MDGLGVKLIHHGGNHRAAVLAGQFRAGQLGDVELDKLEVAVKGRPRAVQFGDVVKPFLALLGVPVHEPRDSFAGMGRHLVAYALWSSAPAFARLSPATTVFYHLSRWHSWVRR